MNWQIVELINGTVRIDDFDEDQPVMTFNAGNAEARRHAELVMKGLGALARELDSVTLGVGDGSGRLFVHGDHESIKACQAIILDRDSLRTAVEGVLASAKALQEDYGT